MSTLSFTKKAAQGLAKAYSTPDVVAQRDTTMRLMQLNVGEHVIDIGCGPGFLCEAIAERTGPTGRVLGVDISADLISFCRDRSPPPHLSYETEDALALSARDSSFDIAVCTQVAEYIPDTERLLAETFRILRPGGRALVMATDWDCAAWQSADSARCKTIMHAWERHCAHPTLPRGLATSLRAAGFQDVEISAHPLINQRFDASTYSYGIAKMILSFVKRDAPQLAELADEWFDELVQLDKSDQFYFASARMIFTALKPR